MFGWYDNGNGLKLMEMGRNEKAESHSRTSLLYSFYRAQLH